MHAARNYGAVLQTYALQEYFKNIGCEVEIINYKLPNQSIIGYLFNVNEKFKKNILFKIGYITKTILPKCMTTKLFLDFQKRKLNLSPKVIVQNNKLHGYSKADIYCAGSDQIWNPRANGGFNPAFFLSGVVGKKISYASSVGIYDLTEVEKRKISEYLTEFDKISVRELSTVPLMKKIGYDVNCVLDPTLLLTNDDWKAFSNENIGNNQYLLVYYFGNTKKIMKTASMIAKKRGLKVIRIAVSFERYDEDDKVERFITPERFVTLFLNASYIITNSFHGTIFSINFNKQFLSYPTTENNARFDSVFKMFNLENRNLRLYSSVEATNVPDLDYDRVNRLLLERRKESRDYIKKSLYVEK